MSEITKAFGDLISRSALFATLLAAAITVIYAIGTLMRSGILRRINIAGFELEMPKPTGEISEPPSLDERVTAPLGETPFESAQLAKYYAQVLAQSRVSFWFSLIFAALGFAVIIASALLYSNERSGTTVASFIAGIIVDSVSALFLVQSRQAQKSMDEFSEKLRLDRAAAESRRIMETVETAAAKDALRIHMSLHLAAVAQSSAVAKTIIDYTWGPRPELDRIAAPTVPVISSVDTARGSHEPEQPKGNA